MAMNLITSTEPRNKRVARPGANGNIHRGAQGKYARNDSPGPTHRIGACCYGCDYCSDSRKPFIPEIDEFDPFELEDEPSEWPAARGYGKYRSQSADYQYSPVFVANAKARPIRPSVTEQIDRDGRKVVYVQPSRDAWSLTANGHRRTW